MLVLWGSFVSCAIKLKSCVDSQTDFRSTKRFLVTVKAAEIIAILPAFGMAVAGEKGLWIKASSQMVSWHKFV